MSKSLTIILEEINSDGTWEIIGIVSNEAVANKFYENNDAIRRWQMRTLDDPELLNRIAKESENKK